MFCSGLHPVQMRFSVALAGVNFHSEALAAQSPTPCVLARRWTNLGTDGTYESQLPGWVWFGGAGLMKFGSDLFRRLITRTAEA